MESSAEDQAKAAAEAQAKAAAELVVKAAEAVDAAAKEVARLLPLPAESEFDVDKKAAEAAAAAAKLAAAAAAAAAAKLASPIVINDLIAAATKVSEASALVLTAAKTIPKTEDGSAAAVEAAAIQAKAALKAAEALKPSVAAAPATLEPKLSKPTEITKIQAMNILTSLQKMLDTRNPSFDEISQILNDNGIISSLVLVGGGGLRKKKTGISRRIRRSRVGANTRKSREFH